MLVRAFVHEAEVQKVKPGMPVQVRVDAFPELVLEGEVAVVSDFYDSSRQWLSGGVKEYATMIQIRNLPDAGLKPGMTTRVEIHAGQLTNSLVVPLAAVAAQKGAHYCYVVQAGGIESRPVRIGRNTDRYVEITQGLQPGEEVALDARHRLSSQLEQQSGGPALGGGQTERKRVAAAR
jgi:hypothetical protein